MKWNVDSLTNNCGIYSSFSLKFLIFGWFIMIQVFLKLWKIIQNISSVFFSHMWISSSSSPLPFQYSFALLEYFFICPIIFQHFDFSSYTQIDWKIISAPYFKTQTFHILSNSFYILFLFTLLVQISKEGALNLELWTWSFGLGALDLSSCYLLMT